MSPTSYRAAPPRGNSVETDCSVEDLNITDYFFVCQEFGKNILDDAGIFGLPSYLLGLIQDMLNTDEFDIEENRLTIRSLLHIVELANDLNMRCWGEQKTPFGLTGIRYDNQYVGFKDETKIIAS